MKKIAFTGGGSAGHVVPNIALIDDLKKYGDFEVCYFGSNGMEKELICARGIPYFQTDCPKLIRSKSFSAFKKNLQIPFRLHRAIAKTKQALKKEKPDLVFSKGGFVALPVVLAARKLKIPCFTHESDYSAGLANRLIAKKCNAVFTSFPETAKSFKNGVFTGAPMRKELFEKDKIAAKICFGLPISKPTILIVGGGQGSEILNNGIRNALSQLQDFSVLHLCGKGNIVKSARENYRQFEYLENIGDAYAAADIILSRAGAGAIFEILALKKPALFIPLENASRGDQLENASYFEKKGLCAVLRESEIQKLPNALRETYSNATLKRNLKNCDLTCGNDRILTELKAFLQ